MKQINFISFIFLLSIIVFSSGPALADEAKQSRHWYRMELQTGDTTYQCIGSSTYDEKELAKQLTEVEYIELDDAAYLDASGKIRGWQEWDPKSIPRLYVNPDYVIFFNPLKDDPRKTAHK